MTKSCNIKTRKTHRSGGKLARNRTIDGRRHGDWRRRPRRRRRRWWWWRWRRRQRCFGRIFALLRPRIDDRLHDAIRARLFLLPFDVPRLFFLVTQHVQLFKILVFLVITALAVGGRRSNLNAILWQFLNIAIPFSSMLLTQQTR